MDELPLKQRKIITPETPPRSMEEARAILDEHQRADRPNTAMRRQASIARRILNEESQLEAERLYAVIRSIKSLKRMRTPRDRSPLSPRTASFG